MVSILLQSCQQHHGLFGELDSERKRHHAASYNTQLGLAYLQQGNRARAKRKLFAALAQAPDSPDVNAAMAWFMEKSGEINTADVYYRKAIHLAPGQGAQLNNYGAFLCRQRHYRQAEVYFLQAVNDAKYDHTAGAYENAGLCAASISDNKKAANYFIQALKHDPSRKQSLYELVKIEIRLGLKDKALAFLNEYKDLSLSDPALLALRQNLDVNYKLHLHQWSKP